MAGLSTYLETALLGWLRGSPLPAAPASVWLSLHDGDPGDGGTGGTEVTAIVRPGGRVAVTFGAPAGGAIANAAPLGFGTAAGAASVSHFGLFDAGTGGNLLASGPIAGGPQGVPAGAQLSVAAGALGIQLG